MKSLLIKKSENTMDQRKKIEQNVKSEITVLRIKLKKNYNKLKSYD